MKQNRKGCSAQKYRLQTEPERKIEDFENPKNHARRNKATAKGRYHRGPVPRVQVGNLRVGGEHPVAADVQQRHGKEQYAREGSSNERDEKVADALEEEQQSPGLPDALAVEQGAREEVDDGSD